MNKIKNVGWTLGNDCPCDCKHCYSFSVREKGKNLTKEMVDQIVTQLEKLEVETINIGGNEPIFTNGLDVKKSMLPYILEKLAERNIKVGITTAGISLVLLKKNFPETLRFLNDVDISLDSPYENEHNSNRGGNIYYYALQAMKICKENSIEAGIIMCAMNWNFTLDRIKGLLELAKKYDTNIRFNILKPMNTKQYNLVPTKEQLITGYNYLFEVCDTIELSEPTIAAAVGNNKIEGCSCGIHSMRINSITPDGKIPVSPCVYMHDFRVGDLLTDDIFEIISSKEFITFRERKKNYDQIKGCEECEIGNICRGGCFAMAYTYNKCKTEEDNLYAKDPFCIKDMRINMPTLKKLDKQLVHENYLCTWIGVPKK